jgi:hypothetical protein
MRCRKHCTKSAHVHGENGQSSSSSVKTIVPKVLFFGVQKNSEVLDIASRFWLHVCGRSYGEKHRPIRLHTFRTVPRHLPAEVDGVGVGDAALAPALVGLECDGVGLALDSGQQRLALRASPVPLATGNDVVGQRVIACNNWKFYQYTSQYSYKGCK